MKIIPNTGWKAVWLSSCLLLTVPGIAFAQPNGDSTAAAQPAPSWVWIQDPWTGATVMTTVRAPDYSLWNGQRVTDYEESLKADLAPPLGVLTIKSLNLQVPIFNGTDDLTLDRGAGRIKGMARTDEEGNLGISGHRDGFFRVFKDIQVGDEIMIQTAAEVEKYEVTDMKIVPKEDHSVLAPTDQKTLTVVTCYPFYFVGHAPERLIVTALPIPDDPMLAEPLPADPGPSEID